MASLWDLLLGAPRASQSGAVNSAFPARPTDIVAVAEQRPAHPVAAYDTPPDHAPLTRMHATLVQQAGFNKHMSALSTRTSLSPEDVMAEALRFANRHQDAFHDFIYKGHIAKPAEERAGKGQINNIVAMVFLLGVLITLIVVLGPS